MLSEERFDTGAVVLNYAVDRADGPPLVLLHGVTNCWQGWLPVAPSLVQRWRLYAPDLRGHGRSGHTPGAYSIPEYAADIVALLREVIGTPAVLVGHSLGAIIAVAVAAAAPEQVAAVVLEDPPLAAFRGTPFGDRPEHDYFVAMRDLAASGRSIPEIAAILGAQSPNTDAVALHAHASRLARLDPDVLDLIVNDRAIGTYDQDACLRAIASPTLLLQADPAAGGALGDADAERAAELLPQGTLVRLPGIGHGIHGDIPARFTRLVHDFLEFR
jgi:pimeloyl-ACP methyl ester carboxylesterase